MNILVINHYAGSVRHGMEFRPFYLAREWVRAGHRVRIVAASYSHLRTKQPAVGARGELDEEIEGIGYRWYGTPAYSGNGVGRAWNIMAFLVALWRDARRHVDQFQPDVVIASSTYPMDIWPARRIAKMAGALLVFELHDLWPLSPIEIGRMSPKHPFILLCQAAENAVYRNVDLVISMLPNVAGHVQEKGFPLTRLGIIPNGVALEDWHDCAAQELRAEILEIIADARANGRTVIGYAGAHGVPNALDTLLDAAILLKHEPVTFVLVGDGHERARLADRVRSENIHNVYMFEPIPKQQVPSLLSQFQAAYLGAPRHALYRYGVSPNKMIDYMMAAVPILYAIQAGNDPVSEADCGFAIPAQDSEALAAAIADLCRLPEERRRQMGENGRRYARTHYTYDFLAPAFLEIVSAVQNRT